jgi:hypothetical protein
MCELLPLAAEDNIEGEHGQAWMKMTSVVGECKLDLP